jgi:hypothetical protein
VGVNRAVVWTLGADRLGILDRVTSVGDVFARVKYQ